MGLWAVERSLEGDTGASITASLGEPFRAGDWEITVLNVREAEYIKEGSSYYKAKEGNRVTIVTIRAKNIGQETKTTSDIWSFVLVSDAGKSYERAYTFELEYIWDLTSEVKRGAVSIKELDSSASVAPGTYVEGDLLFQVPKSEKPVELHFKVGIIGGCEVTMPLS